MERFIHLSVNWCFSASIGSFQGLPAELSEVILLSQRLALKYNTTPRQSCQHFLTSFFQFLCGGGRFPLPSSPAAMPPSPRGRLPQRWQSFRHSPKASPRGMTSPAPGEDVTAGDKKGNLAANAVSRLRGFPQQKPCVSAAGSVLYYYII